tara:strand:- start:9111 stop:11870 length:2760 start_codon:yes stop_codon:yes gene_type:complete
MLLKNLINNCPNHLKQIKVKGLSLDSRTIKKGELFIAQKGIKKNGENYIKDALRKGACAVISSNKNRMNNKILYIKDLRKSLGILCNKFYKKKPKNIFAVTGTNGKSSVADFFHQILSKNNISAATIGTLGVKIQNFKKINLTSPDIITLHKELVRIKERKINNVLVEASSHGLDQGRLNGISFKAGVFTNFSQDHLDYHKTKKNYLNAKLLLFKKLKKNGYLITDNTIPEYKILKKIASSTKLQLQTINLLSEKYELNNFKLIGNFQKKNLLMAIKVCELVGLSQKKISNCLGDIKNVRGRLQLAKKFPNDAKVFIDFAHTPEAIRTCISSLKSHYKRHVTIVVGCGGDRDKSKRSKIGKIINNLCSKIYITDDNPRNENPSKIRKSIIKNIYNNKKVFEIGNRTKAIYCAIKESYPNEIILIAGKGHENIQDYGVKKIKVSDFEIVNKIKIKKKIAKKIRDSLMNNILINKISKTKNTNKLRGVSIDSKVIKKGNLFIAIKGKKKDGHNYIREAISNGAISCVVSKNIKNVSKKRLIKVSNTYSFLKKFAKLKREYSTGKIIAITGSSGKTTVKELIGNLLKNYGDTFFSPKSFNNAYGVPLSLSNLENSHKFGVFEIGMSKSGEINNLSKIVQPHIGIITNIAEAHIENFKNLRHIAKAKGELINNISPSGYLIIDRENQFYNYFKLKAERKKINLVTIGYDRKSHIRIVKEKNYTKYKKVTIEYNKKRYEFKTKNNHVKNVLFAIAVLKILKLDVSIIQNKIHKIEALEGRGKIMKIKLKDIKFNLIDESYNANPLSMKESILNLSKINIKNNKYVLLGDMLELGNKSYNLHRKLSPIINNSKISKLFVHGNYIMNTYKNVKKSKRGNILQCKSDFKEVLLPVLQNNDYLMIKGSNATGLNKISKNLTKGRINAI